MAEFSLVVDVIMNVILLLLILGFTSMFIIVSIVVIHEMWERHKKCRK